MKVVSIPIPSCQNGRAKLGPSALGLGPSERCIVARALASCALLIVFVAAVVHAQQPHHQRVVRQARQLVELARQNELGKAERAAGRLVA